MEGAARGLGRLRGKAAVVTGAAKGIGRATADLFAGEGARTLRVDGPGWSLVARTDDTAFVLLDEEPSEVLAVPHDGDPELPALLAALDRVAVRPA